MRKRIMWFAILLLAICNKIAAEDRVYVSDFSISPGETREINVMLDNEDAYVGFQFDVYLPDGFTITSCSKSDRIPDGTTVLGNQRTDDTGSFYRVIGASLAGNAITGTSGAIATLTITADASVALNDYTGYLRNIKVSKANGTGLTKDQETFTITVKSPEPYAALSSDNKTLTFYYDSQKQTRSGMSIGPFASGSNISWYSQRTSITTVVFDASFANYTNLTSTAYWFIGCHNLTTITGIANLKTDNVTSMVSMFSNCVNLHWVDVSGFNTSNVTDMSNMFMNCSKLEYVDVTHFNTAKVTNMSGMFYGCTDLAGLDVSGFDTGNVTTMKEMFRDCSSLSTLDISNFNTAKVTTMLGMFFGCSHLRALEFGNNFVTSKVQSMSMMFAGCKYLEALDLSNFDTSNVLGMYNMFESCWGLTSLDLSTFNTANLLDMSAMFYDCANLKSINLSSFNTAKVTNMAAMFYECPDLTKLDLKNFNTAKVKEMARMFYNCTSLTTIDVGSEWSTASVTDSGENMFSGCTNLKGGSGTTYDESHIDKEYARIDEGTANPGYLTDINAPDEAYAVLSSDGLTVTFYYDTQKGIRGGININTKFLSTYNGESSPYGSATTAVIDISFANYRPTSTYSWFILCSSLTNIIGIENIKTDNVTNMSHMFSGCRSLTSLDVTGFNTENVKTLLAMFEDCSSLKNLDVTGFNTASVTRMDNMFSGCRSLTSLDVTGFNTENVTSMNDMFMNCSGLTSIDLSNFNTANVTSMAYMFQGCSGLTSLDLSTFNSQNVINMNDMFYGCSSLTSLDLSTFNTDNLVYMGATFGACSALTTLDLSSFNTTNVTSMRYMLYGCAALTTLDLSNFNTTSVTDMGSMFYGCSALTTIYVGEGWNIDNLTESTGVFTGCTALVGGAGTHYDANQTDATYARIDGGPDSATPGYFTRGAWPEPYAVLTDNDDDVEINGTTVKGKTLTFFYDGNKTDNSLSVGPFTYPDARSWHNASESITKVVFDSLFVNCTSLASTALWFSGCKNLTDITDIKNLNTANVTDMRRMFADCSLLTSIDMSNFNTAKVTDMGGMFADCSSLTSIDMTNFNTDNLMNMNGMFSNCSSLTSLDLSNLNTANNADMSGMFSGCSSLSSLDLSNFTATPKFMDGMFSGCSGLISLDLSSFNTSNVTSMFRMFYGCSGLASLDVSNFDTANVTDMGWMFDNCSSLTCLDVANFNTANVTKMGGMFAGCSSLTSLDVSSFNTANVTDMSIMFSGCSALTSLDVGNFDTGNVIDWVGMFSDCSSLTSLDVSNFKTEKVTNMDGMFYGCSALISLDVSNFNTANVTKMPGMFYGCSGLASLDVSHFDTANVTDMRYMFSGCSSLTSLDLSNFNTKNVNSMSEMFSGCSGLTSLDLSNFNTSKVIYDADNYQYGIQNMFSGCSALTTIYVGEGWNIDNLTESADVFKGCTALVGGAGTTYDADHTDYTYAHIDGGPLNPGYLTDKKDAYAALSDDNTVLTFYYDNQKETRGGMSVGPFSDYSEKGWHDCEGNITKVVFDDSFAQYTGLTSTFTWFDMCNNLATIEGLSNLNTENVENMRSMFEACSSLTSLDLSNFNTAKVKDFGLMFAGCTNLATIYVGEGWSTGAVTEESTYMFADCTSLVGGAGTSYDDEHKDATYARIDGGEDNPGYLSDKMKRVKKPTFLFDNENLILATETEGATILYEIKEYNNNLSNDSIAKIAAQMTISDTASVYKDPLLINKDVIVLARGTKEGMKESKDALLIYPCTEWDILMYDIVPMGKQTLQDARGNDMIPKDLLDKLENELAIAYDMYYSERRTTITRDEIRDKLVYIHDLISEISMYKVVTITAKNCTREYGAANPKFEYTVEGAELSGTPTITCAATASSSVGTYPITITYNKPDSESMLNITCVNGTMTITKAPLTITAKNYTIKRGEAIPTFEATYSGFKNKETEAVLTKKPTILTLAKSDSEAGVYDITVSGAEAKNYEIKYANGTLTITDDVKVTAKSYSRVYGEANPAFEFTSEGATLSGKPTITCSATATSPVGTYTITIAKGNITNSEVTYVNGTLTITKAPLTITAKSYTIKQGKSLPEFEVEYSGFKNKETDTVFTTKPKVSTEATPYSEPGVYDIKVNGAVANNYEITYVNGKITITMRTENFDGVVLTVEKDGVIEDAFEYRGGKSEVAKTIAAIVWNDTKELKAEMLDGISNPNLLIYVNDENLAPTGFNNIVVNGVAKNIRLTDGGTGNYNFNVPQAFRADSISYTREFKQATRDSVSRGWEGIALPFTVQTFTHEEHGNISPFGNDACDYHFWLRQPTENGVVSAMTIEANKPYIISMPNSDEYEPEFNHAGWVQFASANVTVPVTDMEQVMLGDSAWIVPTFLEVEQSPDLYVLNVGDSIQNHLEGSVFISNYRSARPFEVYAQHEGSRNSSGARVMSLSSIFRGGKGTTDMGIVTVGPATDAWFDMSGRRLQSKPSKSGLYIHNGKKVFIKNNK